MSEQSSQQTVRLTVSNKEASDSSEPFFEPQAFDHLSEREHIFIGRSPSNDIVLDSISVSGKHACITRQGDDYFVCDLASRNKTFLNGSELVPNDQQLLRSGDNIRVTPYEINIRFGLDVLIESSENTQMLQQHLLRDILPGLLDYEEVPPKLTLVSGFPGQLFLELTGLNTEFKIGRSPHCDLVVQDDNISREHAHFRRLTKGVFVRDNNSRNGIVINGNRISRNTEVRIFDRDELVFGTIKFRFEDPEGEQFSGQIDEVLPSEPEPSIEKPPSISVPKPSSPPPEPYVPPGEQNQELPSNPDGEFDPDASVPEMGEMNTDGEDKPESVENEGENGEESEEEENAPTPHPSGLTGGQKAIIGILVALLFVGFALLFFLTTGN